MVSVHQRPNHNLQITPRDLTVLRGLFESRVMSSRHLCLLYFEGRTKAAAKRLRMLKAAGLIAPRPRLPQEQAIWGMTQRAHKLLDEQGRLSDYPTIGWAPLAKRLRVSPLTLRHELDVMDVKAAVVDSLRQHSRLTLLHFHTWPRLFQFRSRDHLGRALWMRPDGYLEVQERCVDGQRRLHRFYLEVDRSTEVLDVLRNKAACYWHHYRGGGMAARLQQPRQAYKQFPFRTLWIFRSPQRRDNAARMLLSNRPPILTSAWLTTMEELVRDPLASIWLRPADYNLSTSDVPPLVRLPQPLSLFAPSS